MRHHEEDGIPIVQRSYDLCVGLYGHVNRFPRAQRGLLGRVILDDALQLLTVLTLATRRTARGELLEEASGRLDALRIAWRLGRRLGFLSNGGYEEVSKVVDEVGRMLGGWLKHEGANEVTAAQHKPAERPDVSKEAPFGHPPRLVRIAPAGPRTRRVRRPPVSGGVNFLRQ